MKHSHLNEEISLNSLKIFLSDVGKDIDHKLKTNKLRVQKGRFEFNIEYYLELATRRGDNVNSLTFEVEGDYKKVDMFVKKTIKLSMDTLTELSKYSQKLNSSKDFNSVKEEISSLTKNVKVNLENLKNEEDPLKGKSSIKVKRKTEYQEFIDERMDNFELLNKLLLKVKGLLKKTIKSVKGIDEESKSVIMSIKAISRTIFDCIYRAMYMNRVITGRFFKSFPKEMDEDDLYIYGEKIMRGNN